MPSLYEVGWRQGTIFAAELAASTYIYEDGHCVPSEQSFETWVVSSQDCDLAAVDSVNHDPIIEICPVRPGGANWGWGIRSRALRLNDSSFVEAADPRLRISPQALNVYAYAMEKSLGEGRATAFKTWLGRRYDRPAVPEHLVSLARAIADAISKTKTVDLASGCHDILFQVREGEPPMYELTAVLADEAIGDAVEVWLAEGAMRVDASLGVLSGAPLVATKAGITVSTLENSYSAQVSDITWKTEEPRGVY